MKKVFELKGISYLSVLALLIILAVSCAGTKKKTAPTGKEQQTNIDELLGIQEQKQPAGQQQQDEEDILKLLGISKKEEAAPAAAPTAPSPTPDEKLKEQIAQLEKTARAKDAELASLRSDLSAKEEKISKLETDLRSTKSKGQATPTSAGTAPTEFKARYQEALAEYQARNFKVAIGLFEALLATDATNSLSDNCQYWLGECYYGLEDFNRAIVEFNKVFTFKDSNKEDAAQLKLGLCYWKLGDTARAKQEFERLISNYPDSEFVDKARSFLSQM